MINRLQVDNFKCFEKAIFDFRRLNILTGPNSSGKSTVIQAILSNKISGDTDIWNGEMVKLGSVSDIRNCYTRGEVKTNTLRDPDYKDHKIVYLTTERIGPETDYKQNDDPQNEIGVHGEFAFDYLSKNRLEEIRDKSFIFNASSGINLGNQVDYWLSYLCGYTVTAERIEGTSTVRVAYRTEDNIKDFKAIHVGTGVTYLATIIIAAFSCVENDVLIIENPELYLHPAAQSKFTDFFVFLASKGLQIILETHSDHVINGIRKAIKRNNINNNDVAVFYLKKESGLSTPVMIGLSEEGLILNQEKGFFDQFDDDLDILLGFNYE